MEKQYSFCISKTKVLDNRSNFYSVAKTMLYCVTMVVGGGVRENAEADDIGSDARVGDDVGLSREE